METKCLDPDEAKMGPDCMLGPPDEVRVIVQGEVVGPEYPAYIIDCALKKFCFPIPLALCNGTASGE